MSRGSVLAQSSLETAVKAGRALNAKREAEAAQKRYFALAARREAAAAKEFYFPNPPQTQQLWSERLWSASRADRMDSPPARPAQHPERFTFCTYCRRDWSLTKHDNCPGCGAPPQ